MQYPQIQFYKGSLVRLANGQLKQVEDLSSDDFIESARLAASAASTPKLIEQQQQRHHHQQQQQLQSHLSSPLNRSSLSLSGVRGTQNGLRDRFDFQSGGGGRGATAGSQPNQLRGGHGGGSSGTLDENNNSVFNSPEPTSASYEDSPTRMDIEEDEEANEPGQEEDDVELDVVTNDEPDGPEGAGQSAKQLQQVSELVNSKHPARHSLEGAKRLGELQLGHGRESPDQLADFYVDSSVVRDFLEVGPIHEQMSSGGGGGRPNKNAANSSTPSSSQQQQQQQQLQANFGTRASTSGCSLAATLLPQITSAASASSTQTVLIKFFLETSRSFAFIEVPTEHPFFVLHRGWSSWNPQMTYETFGLKCRKLKIGDTCISLIRARARRPSGSHNNESDQCNILFSSININE